MIRLAIIWICAALLAWFAFTTALGGVAKKKSPALAVTVAPVNGFALETIARDNLVSKMSQNGGEFPKSFGRAQQELAKRAFASEPTSAAATALLALTAKSGSKRKLMQKASRLTRRQSVTSAWMIKDSAERDDLTSLLYFYDASLRTNSGAVAVLIPQMVKVMERSDFIAPMRAMLDQNPPWARQFWASLTRTTGSLKNAQKLRLALTGESARTALEFDTRLIQSLVSHEQFESAFDLYAELNNVKAYVSNSDFKNSGQYAPIDWQLYTNGELGASISDGQLQLSAIPNSGGVFAKRLVKLKPGKYKLSVDMEVELPNSGSLALRIGCAEQKRVQQSSHKIALETKMTEQIFNVPSGLCEYYWLIIDGFTNDDSIDVIIDRLALQNID